MSGLKTDVSGTLSVMHTLEDALVIPYSLEALGNLDPMTEDAYSRFIRIAGINCFAVIYSVTDFRKENPNVHAKYCTKDPKELEEFGIKGVRKLDIEVPDIKIVKAVEDTYVVFFDHGVGLEDTIGLFGHLKELAEMETIIERIPKERLGRQRGNAATKYRNIMISHGIMGDPPYTIQDYGRGKGPIVDRYYSLNGSGEIELCEAKIIPTINGKHFMPFDCENLTF